MNKIGILTLLALMLFGIPSSNPYPVMPEHPLSYTCERESYFCWHDPEYLGGQKICVKYTFKGGQLSIWNGYKVGEKEFGKEIYKVDGCRPTPTAHKVMFYERCTKEPITIYYSLTWLGNIIMQYEYNPTIHNFYGKEV